jgi:hypothetical protein
MTSQSQTRRGAQELPETLQIAELLAELMPEPVDAAKEAAPAAANNESPIAEFTAPSLAPDDLEPPPEETPPPVRVLPRTGPATYAVVETVAPAAEASLPPPIPRRAPNSGPITLGELVIEQATAAPVNPPPLPIGPVAAAQRIPLGDLTVAGFFSLVNWRNEQAAVRHPPFAPRYDARTSAELRKIPFILLDEPSVDDSWSVAAVLKSFAW